jgi:hypothetical protein
MIQDRSSLLIAYPHFTFLEENKQDDDDVEEDEEDKVDE